MVSWQWWYCGQNDFSPTFSPAGRPALTCAGGGCFQAHAPTEGYRRVEESLLSSRKNRLVTSRNKQKRLQDKADADEMENSCGGFISQCSRNVAIFDSDPKSICNSWKRNWGGPTASGQAPGELQANHHTASAGRCR